MTKSIIAKGLAALVVSFSLISCGKTDPAQYNNKMMTIINSSQKDIENMNTAMISKDFSKAEEVRTTWEKNLENSIKEVEDIGDFNGSSTFKDAVLKSMNEYKKVVTGDYKTLIAIRKSGDVSKATEEEKVLNTINTTLENAGNSLNTAASAFEAEANK